MSVDRTRDVDKQILDVEGTIARQRCLIAELKTSGLDTRSADAALCAMIQLLEELREHRRDLYGNR